MTHQRANEIYAAHIASGGTDFDRSAIKSLMTGEEKDAIHKRWLEMLGSTSWNDAFFTFMSIDKLPPYMRLRIG